MPWLVDVSSSPDLMRDGQRVLLGWVTDECGMRRLTTEMGKRHTDLNIGLNGPF